MKVDLEIDIQGAKFSLPTAVSAKLAQQLDELSVLVVAMDKLATTWDELPDETADDRYRAILALEMIRKHHLQQALIATNQAVALAQGNVSASQVGFPEFEDN